MKKKPDIFQGIQQRQKREQQEQNIADQIDYIKNNQVQTNVYKGDLSGQIYVEAFSSDANYHSYKTNKQHMRQLQQFMDGREAAASEMLSTENAASILKEATRQRQKLETPAGHKKTSSDLYGNRGAMSGFSRPKTQGATVAKRNLRRSVQFLTKAPQMSDSQVNWVKKMNESSRYRTSNFKGGINSPTHGPSKSMTSIPRQTSKDVVATNLADLYGKSVYYNASGTRQITAI